MLCGAGKERANKGTEDKAYTATSPRARAQAPPSPSLVTELLFLALPCRGREGFCSWRLGAERQQLAGPCFEAASRLSRLILAAARMSEKSADEAPVELGAK
ncbi:hypothetical protein E2320_016826, partial [Naja naja]